MTIAWQGETALCAWVDGEQVAMLDISRQDDAIRVNMVFVKPPFRRRGIGRALLQHLQQCYPQAGSACCLPSKGQMP